MSQRTSWTLKEYLAYLKRSGPQKPSDHLAGVVERTRGKNPAQRPAAPRKRPSKTKAEVDCEQILTADNPKARVLFQAYTLKLAFDTRYTPDFAVVHPDDHVDFVEVKGPFVFEKALNKPKIAARIFPQHKFFLAQKTKESGWNMRLLRSD